MASSARMTGPERRQTTRTTVRGFSYIHIEPDNGGSVLNVSEKGLCFRSIAPVYRDGVVRISFSSEDGRRVQAAGELVWSDETGKTGGVRFTVLSAHALEQIRKLENRSLPASGVDKAPTPRQPLATIAPADSTVLADIAPKLKVTVRLSPFARGMVTGLLVAAFLTAVFGFHAYRQELGQSLIRLGEHFAGARTSLQSETVQPQTVPIANRAASAGKVRTGATSGVAAGAADIATRARDAAPN